MLRFEVLCKLCRFVLQNFYGEFISGELNSSGLGLHFGFKMIPGLQKVKNIKRVEAT